MLSFSYIADKRRNDMKKKRGNGKNNRHFKDRKRLFTRILSLTLSFFMFTEILLSGMSGVIAADTDVMSQEDRIVEKAEDYDV